MLSERTSKQSSLPSHFFFSCSVSRRMEAFLFCFIYFSFQNQPPGGAEVDLDNIGFCYYLQHQSFAPVCLSGLFSLVYVHRYFDVYTDTTSQSHRFLPKKILIEDIKGPVTFFFSFFFSVFLISILPFLSSSFGSSHLFFLSFLLFLFLFDFTYRLDLVFSFICLSLSPEVLPWNNGQQVSLKYHYYCNKFDRH